MSKAIYSHEAVFERLSAFVGVPFHRRIPDDTVIATTTDRRGGTVTLTIGDLRFAATCVDESGARERAEDVAAGKGGEGA
jgi:hypothetical protein